MTNDKPSSWSEAMADEPWEEEHFSPEAIIEAVAEARRIHRENPDLVDEPRVHRNFAGNVVVIEPDAVDVNSPNDNLRPVVNAKGEPIVFIDMTGIEEETEYAVFNDPEVWEPLFASGELPASQRFQLDEPLHVATSRIMIVKFIDLRNLERAQQGKVEKYGYMQLRTRTITRTPWRTLTLDEVASARR